MCLIARRPQACPGRPGLQEGLGRVQRRSGPREPEGAGGVVVPGSSWRVRRSSSGKPYGRGSRAPSPRARPLEWLFRTWGPRAGSWVRVGGASGVHDLLFLAGAAGARKLFIDQTVRAPCVNGTPRASRADIPAPPSLHPLGLPSQRRLPPEPRRPPRPCMARAQGPCVRGAPAPPRASRSA